ncbi:ATP-binding protein [Streptomyces sp. SID10815]|uniref:ATP-binding protein n=1 Tax=Streptomyces sp. SID10815 TaxID=2706027 RepID=UPI0013C9D36A|nr:ATP-binding protein [Streptomyces sp. SID10815]NEA46739.1 ATP-binding protein [Streptomyces sp. SID10815]
MLEVVALSALTTFLLSVGNGAAGEVGKNLTLSAGALVRRTLGRETPLPAGAEESSELAGRLHTAMSRDPRRAGEWAHLVDSAQVRTETPSRGGMPPAPWAFTNRQKVLRQLMREAGRPWEGRPRVALLSGPPGSGTTAVALRLGGESRDRFPDGQFYVDLRDACDDESGPDAAAVLLRLLRETGVEPDRIPATEAGRVRLYRQITEGRKMLVVIDHTTSLAQVRGLVPATPDVFLVVVVSGPPLLLEAERVPVPPLTDRYAKQLVRKVAGQANAARVNAQLPALLERCQGNAFVLHAEARLLARGGSGPAPRAEAWRHHPVRAAAQLAAVQLAPEAARLCRLTALGGWPSVSAVIAAAAAGLDDEQAAGRMLDEAVDVGLLEPLPDRRYRFRPEIRRRLADTAVAEYGVRECSAAVGRVLDALVERVLPASRAALPESWRTELPADFHGGGGADQDGIVVLAAELPNVVRAVTLAEECGRITVALWLARALWPLQLKAGYWDEVLPALRDAARCAEENRADERMAGALHFQLAHCLGEMRREEQANRAARSAVTYERAAGHLRGEASAVELLGLLSLNRWEYEEAYDRFTEAETVYRRLTADQEGAADLPRALALIERHKGRALRGQGRLEESRQALENAVDFFAGRTGAPPEAYNHARALTDLAETLHDDGDDTTALVRIGEAEALLPPTATPHLAYLARLRQRCEGGAVR